MTKQPRLVCEYIERISRDALALHQELVRDYVRGRQGIYALYRRDKLYYIGLASNLNARLKQHLRDHHGGSWDRFSVYLTIGDRHLKELESLLLRVVRPAGNKMTGKFVKAENLRTRFARDVRQQQKEELERLIGKSRYARRAARRTSATKTQDDAPVLAAFATRRFQLRAEYKGQTLKAWVRKDGWIYYEGMLYRSPSGAARAAANGTSRSGWSFWKYQRAPGDWAPLKEIRK